MSEKIATFIGRAHTVIAAPPGRVWEALTQPELVKQYMFGTDIETDWKIGSSIVYRGEWQGKKYEDKGRVLEVVPERLIKSTYWSVGMGMPDRPENYQIVTYELTPGDKVTALSVTQENIPSEDAKAESERNWGMVLEAIKSMLEKT